MRSLREQSAKRTEGGGDSPKGMNKKPATFSES